MGGTGVDHQHGEARGVQVERDLPDGGVTAVDEQGVPGGGAERCGLVHAAGRGPGHLVLGAHAGGREPGAARVVGAEGPVVEELVEGQGDRGQPRPADAPARAAAPAGG